MDYDELRELSNNNTNEYVSTPVMLSGCKFVKKDKKTLEVNNLGDFVLDSELSEDLFNKMIGISSKFDNRNTSEMCENVYTHHLTKVGEEDEEKLYTIHYIEAEGGVNKVRAILPENVMCIELSQILSRLDKISPNNYSQIYNTEEYNRFFPKYSFILTSEARKLEVSGVELTPSVMIQSSELGQGKIIINPCYIFESNGISIPIFLLSDNYWFLESPYKDGKEQTFLSLIDDALTISDDMLFNSGEEVYDKFMGMVENELSFATAEALIKEWSELKGFPKKLEKIFDNNIDTYIELSEANNFNYFTLYLSLIEDSYLQMNFNSYLKAALFLSKKMGLSV